MSHAGGVNRKRTPFTTGVQALRWLLIVAIATGTTFYVLGSVHWPLMCDSPIMHYVVFLTRHGLQPYRQITDNNMPGAYLTESWAISLFGAGDLAWRVYEFFLLAVLWGALIVIAQPYDWLAGFYAGGVFLVLHAADGPNYAGERELVLSTLMIVGLSCAFLSERQRRPLWMLPFSLFTALASSIKPTMVPLTMMVLVAAAYVAYRRRGPVMNIAAWAMLGFASIALVELRFLLKYHAWQPFLFVLRVVTPVYAAMSHPGWRAMVQGALPASLAPIVLAGAAAALLQRRAENLERWNWERWTLLLGAVFGLLSYFVQGKGFNHHRYFFLICMLLLVGLEFTSALRRSGALRSIGTVGLTASILVLPRYLYVFHKQPNHSAFTSALEGDFQQMGLTKLQGKVQCFDLVYGCLNALEHEGLVENSGFTGDLLFFSPLDTVARRYYRNMFWDLARNDPAEVMVVSNEWFGLPNSFDKVDAWPEFSAYLKSHYTQVQSRQFIEDGINLVNGRFSEPEAYRIYVRNGSDLSAPFR